MSKRKKTLVNYEINKNIAKILVLHRKWNKLNQANIAEDLSVTFQQVQKYEKCMNRLSAEMLIDICKKRKWDIALFMCDKPESILDEWIQSSISTDELKGVGRAASIVPSIRKKWEQIDKNGENNYYQKHNFAKGS